MIISPLTESPSSTATPGPALTQTTPVINNVHNNAIVQALMLHAQQEAIRQGNTRSTSTDNKEVADTNQNNNNKDNTVKNENKNNSNNNNDNDPALAVSNTQTNTNAAMASPLLSQYVYVPINLALLASLQTQLQ